MADIKNPKLLYAKGLLLLVLGLLAATLLVLDHPDWRTLLLLAVTVWALARAYYFAFYVVEHYIDGKFKFAGLFSFARYLLRTRRSPRPGN